MADFGKLRRYLNVPGRSAERIRREVDDELRFHIDRRAEALERQGVARDEARARATREFGDIDDASRYCADVDQKAERRRRTTGWLAELHQDAAHALRILRRTPAFATATVLTLAIAIGASTAVYGVLHAYLIRPLPFPESNRLMSIVAGPTLEFFPRMPSLRGVDWTRIDSLFEATAAWDLDGFTIPGEQHAEYVEGAWVAPGFFDALGLRPALGRGFRPDEYRDKAPVVIISHDLWVRRFAGDSSAIGSTVTAHSTDRPREASVVTIVGVTPRGFWPINRFNEVLRPLPESRMPSLARLKPGVSIAGTQNRLDGIVRAQLTGEVDSAWHMTLMPTRDEHAARVRPVLVAVFGAALFMLLAACGSVAGALVSRMATRRGELAVRLALGGSRGRVVRQLLTESAVLATLAGALGLAVAYALLDAAGPLVERQLATATPGGAAALRPSIGIMILSVGVSALAGVALGFVPALTFLRVDSRSAAIAALGAARSSSARGGGARVRRILIAGQVAVAMVLLFGAGLMFRTIARIAGTELGFRADGVVKATMLLPLTRYADSTARLQAMDRVLARVNATEGVRGAAAVFPHPFREVAPTPVIAEGSIADPRSAPTAVFYTVSTGYFETMEIRLRDGRTFRPADDQRAPLVAVVSEALARRVAPTGDAIGRRIRLGGDDDEPWRTVIGVVGETKKTFGPDALPDLYVPYAQNPRAYQSIIVRTDRAESAMFEPVKRAVAAIDPVLALADVESMTDVVARQGAQRRGMTVLLGAFAAFALGLSALALYASLSYTVVQRRSEIAVRMAIGANARAILELVVGEGLITAAFGVAAGVVASLAFGRALQNQVYGIGTSDPGTLVFISFVLAFAAIVACIVPGLRAARTDPALALRD